MHKFFINFILVSFLFGTPVFAQTPADLNQGLAFEIIQQRFMFDLATVERASIIENNGVYKGLQIQLKPNAALQFKSITKHNAGKTINLVLDNKILSSSVLQSGLGDNLLIVIPKADAEAFLTRLKNGSSANN